MNDLETERRLARLSGMRVPEPAGMEALAGRIVRRQRRRAVVGGGAVLLAMALLTAAVVAGRDAGSARSRRIHAADDVTATTAESLPDITSTTLDSTTTTIGLPAVSSTTTTANACRNSYDPACGPYHWSRNPGPNADLTVTMTYSPEHPKAGEAVTFHLVLDDPDAPIDPAYVTTPWFSDGTDSQGHYPPCAPYRTRYGAWDPPPRVHGHFERTYTHTYQSGGDYSFTDAFHSDYCAQYAPGTPHGDSGPIDTVDPYASYNSILQPVHIDPADSGSTSSTTETTTTTTA